MPGYPYFLFCEKFVLKDVEKEEEDADKWDDYFRDIGGFYSEVDIWEQNNLHNAENLTYPKSKDRHIREEDEREEGYAV